MWVVMGTSLQAVSTLKKLLGSLRSMSMKSIKKICFGASSSRLEARTARPTCQVWDMSNHMVQIMTHVLYVTNIAQ